MMMLESGRKQRGMTLVELMIALVIVGILTSVALPLYSRYQERTYRTQAFADLGDCAQALERFYTVNFTYAGAVLDDDLQRHLASLRHDPVRPDPDHGQRLAVHASGHAGGRWCHGRHRPDRAGCQRRETLGQG
ncbi:MAG: prepilin-type N-terminal cleavage/methylation domain-containing protein [Gammaproteobacteria bacterium]|nr:prepilin-type N-terminal cleavage/methylation domain-containing protein [Gammaproteobacteria bacterium]